MIRFDATPIAIEGLRLLRLPGDASRRLPSRGQVAVRGTLDGVAVQTVLEPDGRKGHWMRLDDAAPAAGRAVTVEVEPAEEWPEAEVPADLAAALTAAPAPVRALWRDITPMARWEWVRWVNATANSETRERRVEVTVSKLEAGKRRPCCFDLASCTEPRVSRSGKLVEPT